MDSLLELVERKILNEIVPKIIEIKTEIGLEDLFLEKDRRVYIDYRNKLRYIGNQEDDWVKYIFYYRNKGQIMVLGKNLLQLLTELYKQKEELENFLSIGLAYKRILLIEKI